MKQLNKKKIAAAAAMAGLLCMGSSGVYAARGAAYRSENHLETGYVDIELSEYTIEDGKRVPSDGYFPNILPGQEVSKIPVITNLGTEAYVRAKMDFHDTEYLGETEIFGIDEAWEHGRDGYYYLKKPLKTGESIDFFRGLNIPIDLPRESEGRTFTLSVTAEAVQVPHFTPDYDSPYPWGETVVLEAMDCSGRTDRETIGNALHLIYQGNEAGFVANTSDFFENLPVLYPGDSYSDVLKLSNLTEKPLRLYFRQEIPGDTGLLEKLRLNIRLKAAGNERVIYDGILNTRDLAEDLLLAELPDGENGELGFTITVPEGLDNHYSSRLEEVNWIFNVTEMEKPDPYTGVYTGDETPIALWGFTLGAALLLAGACIYQREKRGKFPES